MLGRLPKVRAGAEVEFKLRGVGAQRSRIVHRLGIKEVHVCKNSP